MNKCLDCRKNTYGDLPFCRTCLIQRWENSKGFIKPKHNPLLLPMKWPEFRSVVTENFITNKQLFIHTLGDQGVYYYDNKHKNYCCVLNQALGNVSGSAIPANYPMPTYPLDSLIVVDLINNPHVFADDYSNIASSITSGKLIQIKQVK